MKNNISEIAINKNGINHSGVRGFTRLGNIVSKKADRLDGESMNRIEVIKYFIDKTMVKIEEIDYAESSFMLPGYIGRALNFYVTHGEFIYAMKAKGFKIEPQHADSSGCWFNLDWDEFKKRCKELFPNNNW